MAAFSRTPRQQLELDDYDDQQESPRLPSLQEKSVATSGRRAQHDFPVSAKEAPSSGSRTPRNKHAAAGGVHHAARGFDQSPQASPTLGGDTAQLSKQGMQTQDLTAMPESSSADVTDIEAAIGAPLKPNSMLTATAKVQARTVPLKQHTKEVLGCSAGSSQAGTPGSFQNGPSTSAVPLSEALIDKHVQQELQQQQPPPLPLPPPPPPQQQQQQQHSFAEASSGGASVKCSSPFARHAQRNIYEPLHGSSKQSKCGDTDHQHSSRGSSGEDPSVADAPVSITEDGCSSSSSTASITAAWLSHASSQHRSSRSSEQNETPIGSNRLVVAAQQQQHARIHQHSQQHLLSQHVPSVSGPHHVMMEASLRLPSSYSFSLTDLYPEAPAAATGIATAPSPAPHESAQSQATAASATVATEALDKLRSFHGCSISTNSRRGSKRGLGLFRHASSAAAAHDRHGRPTASSNSMTLRSRTTAADEEEAADGAQTVAGFQHQRWGMDSVAECDALEAVNRHASNTSLLEAAPVSCHGSMPQPHLLEGSWVGPAMATSPAGAAAASRPGVAKRWLIALALVAAVGLGSLSLMMDAGAAGSGGQLLPEGQPPRLLTTPQQMPAAAGAAPNSAAGGTSATSAAAAVATGVGGSGIVLSTLPPAVSSYLARVHHPAWQEAGHLDLAQIQVVKPSPDDCLRLAGLPAVQVLCHGQLSTPP